MGFQVVNVNKVFDVLKVVVVGSTRRRLVVVHVLDYFAQRRLLTLSVGLS